MKYGLGVLVGVLAVTGTALADITAYFEPAVVASGESTQLVFQSDKPWKTAPDMATLQQNFVVAGQQQRQSSSWVNGVSSARYEILYNVFPRRDGTLSAGPFVIDGETVAPAVLTVQKKGEVVGAAVPVQVSADIQPAAVYPGQTARYTIRITASAELIDSRMTPPAVDGARVSLLDMDKAYQATDNGRPVRVFERTFGIVPEKSGSLAVGAAEFYGIIPAAPAYQRRDPFDFFDQGILFNGLASRQKEVLLTTEPLTLTVREKPVDWQGWWLPSTLVTITVADKGADTARVGESIERVITVTASGVTAEQLPVVVQSAGPGIKVYPSPEKRETKQTESGELVGIETVAVILVPTAAGEVTIPEIRVPWFNVATGKTEWAVVPAKTLAVQAGTMAFDSERLVPPKPDVVEKAPEVPAASVGEKTQRARVLIGGLLMLIVGLVGGYVLAHLLRRRSVQSEKGQVKRHHAATRKQQKKKKPIPDLYPF